MWRETKPAAAAGDKRPPRGPPVVQHRSRVRLWHRAGGTPPQAAPLRQLPRAPTAPQPRPPACSKGGEYAGENVGET